MWVFNDEKLLDYRDDMRKYLMDIWENVEANDWDDDDVLTDAIQQESDYIINQPGVEKFFSGAMQFYQCCGYIVNEGNEFMFSLKDPESIVYATLYSIVYGDNIIEWVDDEYDDEDGLNESIRRGRSARRSMRRRMR